MVEKLVFHFKICANRIQVWQWTFTKYSNFKLFTPPVSSYVFQPNIHSCQIPNEWATRPSHFCKQMHSIWNVKWQFNQITNMVQVGRICLATRRYRKGKIFVVDHLAFVKTWQSLGKGWIYELVLIKKWIVIRLT